jgi:hypothetical protein
VHNLKREESVTDNDVLDILRAQGHAAGIPDRNRWVRVWTHGSDDAIDVKAGRELHELAERKLSFDEICEPEDEAPVER